jgi:hypothetical protein
LAEEINIDMVNDVIVNTSSRETVPVYYGYDLVMIVLESSYLGIID